MRFSEATAVTVDGTAASASAAGHGQGRWHGRIQPGWDIAGAANGGYLLAIAGRAALAASGRATPISVTAHYLQPGQPGPVVVDVEPLRAGRSTSVLRATLRSDGVPLLSSLGTFGPWPSDDVTLLRTSPPVLPPVGECLRAVPTDTFPPPFVGRVDLRLHPDDAAFLAGGTPSGEPRMRGWLRLLDDEPLDPIALLVAADALPPTAFAAGLPVSWVPTIDLTVHVRGRPAAGWLRCSFVTRAIAGGALEVDGEIWDADGRLVAQARQLARVPRA